MRKKFLKKDSFKKAISSLLAFTLAFGSINFNYTKEVKAQSLIDTIPDVVAAKAETIYYGSDLVLDVDGNLWAGGNFNFGSGAGNNASLKRVKGIDKPIEDIKDGYGTAMAYSTDKETIYLLGVTNNFTGLTTSSVNNNVKKYEFFERHGTYIVDIAIFGTWTNGTVAGYVVDSAGDLWTFGYASTHRGGSGTSFNKITNFFYPANLPAGEQTKKGKFVSVAAPDWTNNTDGQMIALTDEGEVFIWGNYVYSNRNYYKNSTGGTHAQGQPVKIDTTPIADAEGTAVDGNTFKKIASGFGSILLTNSGNLYFLGYNNDVGGSPAGLGRNYTIYDNDTIAGQTVTVAQQTSGKSVTAYNAFYLKPTQVRDGHPEAYSMSTNTENANSVTKDHIANLVIVDADITYGQMTILDENGNTYGTGENWNTYRGDTWEWYYLAYFEPSKNRRVNSGTNTKYESIGEKIVAISNSRQAITYLTESGKIYHSNNEGYSHKTSGNDSSLFTYNVELPLFKKVEEVGNVIKDISATPGNSVITGDIRTYSEPGYDKQSTTISNKLKVTMAKQENRTDGTVLSMHNQSVSSMRYVVIPSTYQGSYAGETYYNIALGSLEPGMVPNYLEASSEVISVSDAAFEQMYADGGLSEKGIMTKTSGTSTGVDTVWETEGNVSGNSMVVVQAKTISNSVEYTNIMAFPIDNYYKQTKSYYKGTATTNAYAGTINLYTNKVIPGNYGVFVDDYNNVLLDKNGDYNPPNGIDTTPDLSTYGTTAGEYLTSPTLVSPKLAYWQPKGATNQKLTLNPTNPNTPYEVLSGTKVDVNNTLTYEYEKIDSQWNDATIHYGSYFGGSYINLITDGYIDDTVAGVLEGGAVENFWPNTKGKYSDGGDVFTPAPLNAAGMAADYQLVGYKIGSEPKSETDYIRCTFAYNPLTGEFDFNPVVPQGTTPETDLYLVYKSSSVALIERYLNADEYVTNTPNPVDWNHRLTMSVEPQSAAIQGFNTSGSAIEIENETTSSAAVQLNLGINPLALSESGFYEIDRITGGTDDTGVYSSYFQRTAAVAVSGTIGKYEKPYTNINNHVLVGYFDEEGTMYSFWNDTEKDFSNIPSTINTKNAIDKSTVIRLIYLTDENVNGIPDVMEGSVEEKWVAITTSGSKVLMNRKFTTGYKDLDKYSSREENFAPGSQWIYKSTTTSTDGVEGAETSNKIISGLSYIDDQPTKPDSIPAYSGGKYSYNGSTGFKTVTYYYNEDSNENGVIDVVEPIKVTVKGVNEQGKELYSWPIASSFSEAAFEIDAMQLPTYTNVEDPELNAAASVATTINSPSKVTVVPSSVPVDASASDRNLVVTFVYQETLAPLTIKQFDLSGTPIGEYSVTVDYSKTYNSVVPAIKGYTFNEAKTIDPDGDGTAYDTIPAYSNGKIAYSAIAEDGSSEIHLYYSKDNGNITLYAVDIDTLDNPIIIGSTTNRVVNSGEDFDPTLEESFPLDFEIPTISNYELKAISTTSPFNPSFDAEGNVEATTQTYNGSDELKDVYYFYTRKNAVIVSQAFVVAEDGTAGAPILNENNAAVARIYDAEVGQTEIISAPTDKALRHYVLVGFVDAQGNVIKGGSSTSVYILDDNQRTVIKFLYRELQPKEIKNIAYVDRDGDGEYTDGDYLIADRVLNMLEDEVIDLIAPDILSYKFEESYAEAEDGSISIEKSNDNTISVNSSKDFLVYFRYTPSTSEVTLKAQASNGPDGINADISDLIPDEQKVVIASTGLEYIAYAPHIPGYYLTGPSSQNIGVVTGDMVIPNPFMYAPLEDIAEDYMATVTIRGLNIADDSALYEFEVFASKGKDFTANSINLPTYKVLKSDKVTESDTSVSETISIGYNDDTMTIDFYYKSQEMKVTAYYWDEVNNEFFATSKEVIGAMKDMPITEYADYHEGYYYLGYSTTKPTDTSTASNTNPLGKIDKVDLNNNSIYFYYKQFTTENIEIFYVEDNGSGDQSTMPIIATKSDTVASTNGATKTVVAEDLSSIGYTSPAVVSQIVTYVTGQNMYKVYFVYTKELADITVKADLYEADGVTLIEAGREIKVMEDQRVAETVYVEPPYVSGFYTEDGSKIITVGGTGATITFKYLKLPQQSVTVVAKENDTNGQVISSYTITADIDAPVYLKPTKLIGWKLVDPTDETTNTVHFISKDAETIEYYYKKDEATLNIELYDKNGVDISGKLSSAQLTYYTPNSNTDLGYTLKHRVYAPNIPNYVLVDPSKYYIDFTDANKGTPYRFIYQHIDDIAVDHMAKAVVRGEYEDIFGVKHELFSYKTYVPLNKTTTVEYIEMDGYELASGETSTRDLTPTRNGEVGTVDAGIVTFVYESTAGEVTIIQVDDGTNEEISKITKRDSTIGQPYTVTANAIEGKYFIGYSLDSADPNDIVYDTNGRIKSTAYIESISADGHKVYFHYKDVTDGLFFTFVEETENGIREIMTIYGGQPGTSTGTTYSITAETTYTDADWFEAPDLKGILDNDYYTLVTGDSRYPETQEVTIYSTQAEVHRIYYLYKKETVTVRAQLYEDSSYTNKIVEDGAYYDMEYRLGEYSVVLGPDSVNYTSIPRRKGVFITDTTTEVKFLGKVRTAYTTTVNYVNANETDSAKKIFGSYSMELLQGQKIELTPKNQIGWQLTSSAAVTVGSTVNTGGTVGFEGGVISKVNFEYVPYVQKFNVRYQADGVDIETGLVDTFETARYDSVFNMEQYSDIALYAKSFEGYILVPNEAPVKTYSISDHTSDGSDINVVFNYVKITEMLDEYTVKVNVKGIGTDDTTGGTKTIYEYTLTFPENTIEDFVITTQTVPERYFYKNVTINGGSLTDSDYTQDANTKAVTLLKTNDSSDGEIDITFEYEYIPLGSGMLTILAVSSEDNAILSSNVFTANLGTKLSSDAPTIKGYTLTNPTETKKEGIVKEDPTEVIFFYTPDPKGSAIINYNAGGTTVKTDTITGIVASETTNYILPETFVYNGTIYNLDSSTGRNLTVEADGSYNALYVDAGPAKEIVTETIIETVTETVTITEVGTPSIEKVYVEVPVEVEVPYEVHVPVRRVPQTITSGRLYVGVHVPYTSGYEDGTFRPDGEVTRAEVATMFYNLSTDKNKAVPIDNVFDDIKSSDWYSQQINYLASQGVLNGYTDGTFRPNDTITRAEFAKIASKFDEMQLSGEAVFPDVDPTHWAEIAIDNVYTKGWMSGYPTGEFKPNGKITRAESVRIINCMIGRSDKTIYTQEDNRFTDVSPNHWAFQEIIEATIKYAK